MYVYVCMHACMYNVCKIPLGILGQELEALYEAQGLLVSLPLVHFDFFPLNAAAVPELWGL